MKVRALSEDSGGTCDWGGCDDESVQERFSVDLDMWLPVCAKHGPRERRGAKGRAECAVCGKDHALTLSGTLPRHGSGVGSCAGSFRRPAEKGEDSE